MPGYLCEVHHVDDWAQGGPPTSTTPPSPAHHPQTPRQRLAHKIKLTNGQTQWTPPPQLPLPSDTNDYHHPGGFFEEKPTNPVTLDVRSNTEAKIRTLDRGDSGGGAVIACARLIAAIGSEYNALGTRCPHPPPERDCRSGHPYFALRQYGLAGEPFSTSAIPSGRL